MEIAKDHVPNNSTTMCNLIQSHPYFESEFGSPSGHGFDHEHHRRAFEEGSSSEKSTGVTKINLAMSSSSSLSSPTSTNSDGLGYPAVKYGAEEGHSVISFKAGYGNFAQTVGSLLSFDQNEGFSQNSFPRMISTSQDDYSIWEDNLQYNYQNQVNSRGNSTNPQLLENSNNIKTTNSYASTSSEVTLGWFSSEPNANMNCIQVLGRPEDCLNKRPFGGESTQVLKKQCTVVSKTPKSNKSKDPQSIAAKNRRERISERLKILQDLVPNGSKVDLVTMLEKAISYVKFLQLQVKVLATDEFWPAQGGKAPDLSQVREAIDAILASQRDRNSSSK